MQGPLLHLFVILFHKPSGHEKYIIVYFFYFFLKAPTGVFNGVLKYESDYDMAGEVGKVLTTIYENDSKGRVESTNIQTKSSIGTPTTKDQNVLLFDFSKQQETHLQTLTSRAISWTIPGNILPAIQTRRIIP